MWSWAHSFLFMPLENVKAILCMHTIVTTQPKDRVVGCCLLTSPIRAELQSGHCLVLLVYHVPASQEQVVMAQVGLPDAFCINFPANTHLMVLEMGDYWCNCITLLL